MRMPRPGMRQQNYRKEVAALPGHRQTHNIPDHKFNAQENRKPAEHVNNVPSNFLKSVCAQNFLCATFYQHSSTFRTTCTKCVKNILKREIFVRSKFLCVRSSHGLCARENTRRAEGEHCTSRI